jgi:D-arginine dehydrogenase
MARTFDFLVIGGGIAGASAAFFLARHGKVGLIEQERQLGYHSTARSAAVYSAAYGPRSWQIITSASRSFLVDPPHGFRDTPLTKPLGALYLAAAHEEEGLRALAADLARRGVEAHLIAPQEAARLSPAVRMEPFSLGLYEPGCVDLDASALLHGFVRGARQNGAMFEMIVGFEALRMQRSDGRWVVDPGNQCVEAAIIVNAAGAWADTVAERAGLMRRGVRPFRRTAITFDPPMGHDASRWPMTFDVAESWYFRPEGPHIMMSPADLLPTEPCDAQPEEIDVAVAIDRIETVTNLKVGRLASRWAGLRTFAPDHEAVIGPDPLEPSFIWYAGQGGNGVMGSVVGGEICAALAVGERLPTPCADLGLSLDMITPARLKRVT